MASEIRANTLKNRVGLGTVSFTNTGPVVSGIVTIANSTSEGVRLEDNAGVGNSLKITTPTGYVSIGSGNSTFVHLQTDRGIYYFNRRITVDEGIISSYDENLVLQSPMNTNRVTINKTTGLVSIVNDLDVDGHTNLDNVSVAGVTTFTGSVTHGSSINLGGELNFTGNGHKYIDVATLNGGNTLTIRHQDGGSYETAAYFDANGGGYLQFNGATKFATTNTGVSVTGNISATGNLIPGGTLYLTDAIEHTDDSNTKIRFPAVDTISMETAGSEKLRITSAGFVQIGAAADAAEAPLHVTAENSQGINAIFGAKDFVDHNNYNYADANIALQGRDADDNDTGAGIQFTVRTTSNNNWLHGAITMDQSGNYIFKNGGAGTTVGTERLRITSDGKFSLGNGGNTSPSAAFHLDYDSNNLLMLDNSTASTQKIFFAQNASTHAQIYATSNTGALTIESDPSNNHSSSFIDFRVDGGEKLRIDSSGNLLIDATGVGNASTYARNLFISGSSNNGITIHTTDTSGSNRKCCIFFGTGTSVADMADGMLFYDNQSRYFHMSTAGAGTGVTQSSMRLDSLGSVRFDSTPTTVNSISLRIQSHKTRTVDDNNGIAFFDEVNHTQAAIAVQKKSTSNATSDLVFRTSSGQVVGTLQGIPETMRIDSNGNVTKPKNFHILVNRNGNQTGYNASNMSDVIIWNRVITGESSENASNHFNTSTGLFTAPVTGMYLFHVAVNCSYNVQGAWLNINGSRPNYAAFYPNGAMSADAMITYHVTAGQTVGTKWYYNGQTNGTINSNNHHTWWRIILLG